MPQPMHLVKKRIERMNVVSIAKPPTIHCPSCHLRTHTDFSHCQQCGKPLSAKSPRQDYFRFNPAQIVH